MKKILLILPLVLGLLFTQSCKKEEEVTQTPTVLAIGDFYQGGVIFYLDNTKKHGLICAVSDQSKTIRWKCASSLVIDASGTDIGTGATNTAEILSVCNTDTIAAGVCDKLDVNGYSDWYLPSKDELNQIYQNMDVVNTTAVANGGTLLEHVNYWTSSHMNSNTVWVQIFASGGAQYGNAEDETNHVRAIRTF